MDLSPRFQKMEIYRQNWDINKWKVWIREAFLGQISASSGAMDGWRCCQTWQTYNHLSHVKKLIYYVINEAKMIILWLNFRIRSPPSRNLIFGSTGFPKSQLAPDSGPGPESSWASNWQLDYHTRPIVWMGCIHHFMLFNLPWAIQVW